ncbi:MAG: sulfide:quinone oxidoreductase [Cryomorphaceae bacterium]|jgi:sulfide:quinone oxidoreductase
MHIEQLTTQVSASDQITVDDVAGIAKLGVDLLVCNRPDGEDEGQTPYAEIAAEAVKHGLRPILMPFSSYQITCPDRDEFIKLIETRKRIHTYCRSGARCKRLWREANSVVGGEEAYNALHAST